MIYSASDAYCSTTLNPTRWMKRLDTYVIVVENMVPFALLVLPFHFSPARVIRNDRLLMVVASGKHRNDCTFRNSLGSPRKRLPLCRLKTLHCDDKWRLYKEGAWQRARLASFIQSESSDVSQLCTGGVGCRRIKRTLVHDDEVPLCHAKLLT